jgi:hypothetical protein
MKAVDDGGSSLLDNSIMMLASNLYDGDAHGADQMPIIMAGGGIQGGRAVDVLEAGNENRRACSLYLSIMDRMGVKLDRFGDTDMRMKNIFPDAPTA